MCADVCADMPVASAPNVCIDTGLDASQTMCLDVCVYMWVDMVESPELSQNSPYSKVKTSIEPEPSSSSAPSRTFASHA